MKVYGKKEPRGFYDGVRWHDLQVHPVVQDLDVVKIVVRDCAAPPDDHCFCAKLPCRFEPPKLVREVVTPREHRQRRAEAALAWLGAGVLAYMAGWALWTAWRLLG